MPRIVIFLLIVLAFNTVGSRHVVAETPQRPADGQSTFLITNMGRDGRMREIPVSRNFFNVRLLFYGKDFAEKHGFPLDRKYVLDEKPAWLHVIEFNLYTFRNLTKCELRIVVADDIDLDFPEKFWISRYLSSEGRIAFPFRKNIAPHEEEVEKGDDEVGQPYGDQKIFRVHIRSSNYSRNADKGRGFFWGAQLMEIDPHYFPDSKYIRINIPCGDHLAPKVMDAQSGDDDTEILISLPSTKGVRWYEPEGEYVFAVPNSVWHTVMEHLQKASSTIVR